MKKNHLKTILLYVVVLALVLVAVRFLFQGQKNDKLVLADVVQYFEADRVESFVINENYVEPEEDTTIAEEQHDGQADGTN